MSLRREFFKTAATGFVIAFLILSLLFEIITKIVIREKISQARNIATTIIYYRHYLSDIAPNVKIINPHISPFALTPAYVTDQVAKNLRKDKFYVKQVSDRYRNSMDKPKPFELNAIKYFKTYKNKKEYIKVFGPDKYFNQKHVFYARKLMIEKSCLKCHGIPFKDVPAPIYKKIVKIYGNRAFNYKVGDVRGIISIVFPYQKVLSDAKKIFAIIISIGLIFFFIGLFIFFRLHKNIENEINKILNHFKFSEKGKYPIFKDKMKFKEFEHLKKQINKTFFKIKKYQGSLYHKYYFHILTNLPNRNKFFEEKKNYPIVLVNIDAFKEINYYFGDKVADELIKQVAERLKNLKKIYAFKLYHIGIDEFAILFKNKNIDKTDLKNKLKSIINDLEKPYQVNENEIVVRFRAGVSCYKKSFLRAESALDMAKKLKKEIVFANEIEHLENYKEHLEMLKKLQWALKNDKIIPFYQPIVNKNKNIIKYEALVRLIDENGNVLSPFFFLDVAKKSRFYLEITKRVIDKVIEKIIEKNISISVNITLEDIEDKDMRQYIFDKLNLIEDKSKITFEIVENEDVKENEIVKEFLKKIKNMGAMIYIDDFGSGYANFDYLIKLEPNGVKIDGTLIKNIINDKSSQIIVQTIVSFAKEMNIKTIAEFVENEEIFEMLKKMGIDYYQGYYFSPPKSEL